MNSLMYDNRHPLILHCNQYHRHCQLHSHPFHLVYCFVCLVFSFLENVKIVCNYQILFERKNLLRFARFGLRFIRSPSMSSSKSRSAWQHAN